jgi:rhodanese-related sulfurtransferase
VAASLLRQRIEGVSDLAGGYNAWAQQKAIA